MILIINKRCWNSFFALVSLPRGRQSIVRNDSVEVSGISNSYWNMVRKNLLGTVLMLCMRMLSLSTVVRSKVSVSKILVQIRQELTENEENQSLLLIPHAIDSSG